MNTACPICNNCSPILADRFKTEQIIQKYLELNIEIGQYYKGYEDIALMGCRNTSTRFFSPSSLAGDARFYELLYKTLGSQLYYPEDKWEHYKAAEFIIKNDLKSILDIGAGSGIFLERLPKDRNKNALEFNNEAIKVLNEKAINAYCQNIEEFSSDKANLEKYDIITAFQVLEHIPNVFSFINSILKCLKPGGYIVFGTPNNVPYLYGYDKYHALNLPPHHINLFNSESFKKISKFFSLRLVDIDVEKFNLENFSRFVQYTIRHYLGFYLGERIFFKIIQPYIKFLNPISNLFKKKNRNILVIYKKLEW